ncbi:hypothetical protein EP837_02984 [Sphingobium sp. EP60837]|nr:hypothetical protein EP837_02984 [Sphingobium sp. EP60837]
MKNGLAYGPAHKEEFLQMKNLRVAPVQYDYRLIRIV